MLGKYCMGYRPVEVAILYSVRDIAVGWAIFATYFLSPLPGHFWVSWHSVITNIAFKK